MHQKIIQYTIAVLIPIAALGIAQFISFDFTKSIPLLLFLAGVILSTFIGGIKTGIITTSVSGLLIMYFSLPQLYSPTEQNLTKAVSLVLFITVGIFISLLVATKNEKRKIQNFLTLERKLRNRILELEKSNIQAQKEIRSRDEFLSIASHELKTPLTSMLLQTQHAVHSIKNATLANFSIESLLRMLGTVENQTKRLSKMINDLLNVSLITTGNLQLEFEEVDLNNLVVSVLDEFSPKLERDHYVVTLTEKDHIKGYWDKIRIEQAFSNILSNAIKYGEKKPIEVIIKKSRNNAHILVQDLGLGIPKEKQKKIFDLFDRGSLEHHTKGLGVGLYITQKIVKSHGGNITVSSAPKKGSTFTIQLPITPPLKI